MRQHQKHIQDLKANRRHDEEVYRYQALDVIIQEGPPPLGRWFPTAHQILAYAGFADIDAKFQQLPMNARGSPDGIFTAHCSDQLTDFPWHGRTATLATSN